MAAPATSAVRTTMSPHPIGRPLEIHEEVGDVIAQTLRAVLGGIVTPRDAELPL
jgi:hypothetical protein